MRRSALIALAAVVAAGGLLALLLRDGSTTTRTDKPRRSSAPAAAAMPPVPVSGDLTYGTAAGTTEGITLRRAARPRGLIILVHGGGFRSGDRSGMDDWGKLLKKDGYATATIDYRLAGPDENNRELALTRARDDTIAALTRLQADPALRKLPVAVWGYSAGALTALRVAADHPERVGAAVSLAGYELPATIRAGHAPLLLFNGTADRAEPVAKATATCRAAHAVGVRCDQVVYPGVTHQITAARGQDIHRKALPWLAARLR
jgi:dipeptidyl aminopeptidase/acylaminoacyl peptidase